MYSTMSSTRRRSVITAASTSVVMPATPTNVCASSSRSSGESPANGPVLACVNATAMPADDQAANAAPGCQKRSAAQIRGGKIR